MNNAFLPPPQFLKSKFKANRRIIKSKLTKLDPIKNLKFDICVNFEILQLTLLA